MEKLKQETTVNLLNVENLSVETSENQYFIGINRPPKEEHNNKTLNLVFKTNIVQIHVFSPIQKKFHLASTSIIHHPAHCALYSYIILLTVR